MKQGGEGSSRGCWGLHPRSQAHGLRGCGTFIHDQLERIACGECRRQCLVELLIQPIAYPCRRVLLDVRWPDLTMLVCLRFSRHRIPLRKMVDRGARRCCLVRERLSDALRLQIGERSRRRDSRLGHDRVHRHVVRLRVDGLETPELEADADGQRLRVHGGERPVVVAAAVAEPKASASNPTSGTRSAVGRTTSPLGRNRNVPDATLEPRPGRQAQNSSGCPFSTTTGSAARAPCSTSRRTRLWSPISPRNGQ